MHEHLTAKKKYSIQSWRIRKIVDKGSYIEFTTNSWPLNEAEPIEYTFLVSPEDSDLLIHNWNILRYRKTISLVIFRNVEGKGKTFHSIG